MGKVRRTKVCKQFWLWRLLLVLVTALVGAKANFANIQTTTYDGIPDGWYSVGAIEPFFKIGTRYYFVDENLIVDWYEANYNCRQRRAQLATIESATEMKAIEEYLISRNYRQWIRIWLAGNDLSTEGHFVSMSTGAPMTYANWQSGQPDNAFANENCVHLAQVDDSYLMNDLNCKEKAYYICQANDPKTVSFTVW